MVALCGVEEMGEMVGKGAAGEGEMAWLLLHLCGRDAKMDGAQAVVGV